MIALQTCVLALSIPAFAQDTLPSNLKLLQEFEISPTKESVSDYLISLHPSPQDRELLGKLVAELGSDNYSQRESATRQLLRRPSGVMQILEEATKNPDFEIRWRSKQILDHTERESRRLLEAVFVTVHKEKLAGLCRPLFGAIPLCKDDYLRIQLRRALAETSTEADSPFVIEQLRSADVQQRVAAIATLGKVSPKVGAEQATTLLGDESPLVQLAALRVLANQGRRDSLPHLVRLLDSPDTPVRTESIRILRAFTGQHFSFTVYEPAEKRAVSVEQWKKWLAVSGQSAELKFPLSDVAIDLGRLLVCDMGQQKVIEYDNAGVKTWEKQVGQAPWACFGLSNGHRIVGSYQEKTVVEYDEAGNEFWRMNDLPGGAMGVQRLENGNTLLAIPDAMQVIEVSPDKKIIWKAALNGRPTFARRLEDGRTLVSLQQHQKVVEVDEGGKVAWEVAIGGMSFSADRTTAGTTLICDLQKGEVREYDRSGAVVFKKAGFSNPYTVQRLTSGNTLVVDRTGVKELDPMGNIVKDLPMTNVYRAHRY
ncbi:MAG: HEAT repeat domain-containing protein [Planctomycetales bacterium]|nr:HEAT repeat domain-containing protein [Planctomycetales bacterium]